MVHYLDKLVGQVVQEVEDADLTQNTLILFTSDNGTSRKISSRLHGGVIQGGKRLPTDAGTRVPLIAYGPATVPVGQVCDDLVDFSDFLPTLLAAVGAEPPIPSDGRSFWPQLCGQDGSPRESLFCYYCPRPEKTPPVRFARDQRWKLYGDGRFFDVKRDPLEQQPLDTDSLDRNAESAWKQLTQAIAEMPTTGQALLQFPAAADN